MSRKAAYVDFAKPEYKNLSDNEVEVLKQLNTRGDRKNLRNYKTHGFYQPVFMKIYDKNYRESNFVGCIKCFEEKK